MKTNQKISPTIAKALAQKVYSELKQEANKKDSILYNEYKNKVKDCPELKNLKKLNKDLNKLKSKIQKKYKISLYSDGTFYMNNKFESNVPSIDTIKVDIMLMSFSQGENLTSEQLIKKLVKQYSK